MKKIHVMHPLLFAIFPILFLFSHNMGELSFAIDERFIIRLVIPTVITLCVTLLVWLLLAIISKDIHKTGILVSIFLFMFFSWGHFSSVYHNVMVNLLGREALFTIGEYKFERYELYFFLCVMLVSLAVYFLKKTLSGRLAGLTRFLNILAGTLIILSLGNIIVYETKRSVLIANKVPEPVEVNSVDVDNEIAATLPDMYYIILDSYAAASTLKEMYAYDNQDFLDYLREKGFYIASKSRSNYAFTILSIPSSLNMEYLNYLSDTVGKESKDLIVPIRMAEHNKIMRVLKSKGYTCIQLGSRNWAPTEYNRYADMDVLYNIPFHLDDKFISQLIGLTVIKPFINLWLGDFQQREITLSQFSQLAQLHTIEGPIFVFAHIYPPHVPYIFGANGEKVSNKDRETLSENTLYVNQLMFINKKVKTLIDEILSTAEKPPIIILQADHGPWELGYLSTLTEEAFKVKMRILNAYYFPPGDQVPVYDSITPVNTFRMIFNHYLGTNYELLDDQSYYSDWRNSPYQFMNVTETVKYD